MSIKLPDALARAKDFFETRVHPWWRDVVCQWDEENRKLAVPLLLAGIFLSMRELLERIGQGGNYFRISPYKLTANAAPIRVLEKEPNGLSRRVFVWVDSAIGLPDPRIRIGTAKSNVNAGGVLLTPGVANEIGKMPPNNELWMSSDVTLNIYLVEEA